MREREREREKERKRETRRERDSESEPSAARLQQTDSDRIPISSAGLDKAIELRVFARL